MYSNTFLRGLDLCGFLRREKVDDIKSNVAIKLERLLFHDLGKLELGAMTFDVSVWPCTPRYFPEHFMICIKRLDS